MKESPSIARIIVCTRTCTCTTVFGDEPEKFKHPLSRQGPLYSSHLVGLFGLAEVYGVALAAGIGIA